MSNFIDLAKILAERKLLREGVTISAKVPVRGFGGAPMTATKKGIITSVNNQGFTALYEDRKVRTTGYETLEDIEGMELPRYAQAYKVKVNYKKPK
jgi:hypothetical protein